MHQIVSVDPFSFESATGRLWCGAQEVKLTPKAVAALEALVANAGEPVSKQELFASAWRDLVASDDAVISVILSYVGSSRMRSRTSATSSLTEYRPGSKKPIRDSRAASSSGSPSRD